MTKFFERGNWLLQYENTELSFNVLAFYKEDILFWIRRSKIGNYFEFELMGVKII